MDETDKNLTAPLVEATDEVVEKISTRTRKKNDRDSLRMTPKLCCVFFFLFLLGIIQIIAGSKTALTDEITTVPVIDLVAATSLLNVVMILLCLAATVAKEQQEEIRSIVNGLRNKFNYLKEEVKNLTIYVTKLQQDNQKLAKEELELHRVAEEQKTDVNSFIKLLVESQDVATQLERVVVEQTKQNLSTAVMRAFDSIKTGKNFLDDGGLYFLMLQVDLLENKIDEKEFEARVRRSDRKLISILRVAQNMFDGSEEDSFSLSRETPFSASVRR